MSFKSLLKHRCDIYDHQTRDKDGVPLTKYFKLNDSPVKCRLDLNFIRQGRDSRWVDVAARPQDRAGTLFIDEEILSRHGIQIKSGMRISMVRGPKGTFQMQGAIDEAWGESDLHHYEIGVIEVSTLSKRSDLVQTPGEKNSNPLDIGGL